MLAVGSKKVEPTFYRLAIIEVGIPYGCSRSLNGIEKLVGTNDLFGMSLISEGVWGGPLGPT